MNRKGPTTGFIFATLVAALALTVLPLPSWAEALRPEWAALVVAYWSLHLPQRVSIGTAWTLGLALDVLKGALLGEHALALTVVAFLVARFHLQIRAFPIWQQVTTTALLLAVFHFIAFWMEGVATQSASFWPRLPSVAITALLWPWLVELMRALRVRREFA